jgi:DNA-binding MarR family transcriptional regulator
VRLSEVAAAEGINPTMLSRVISELAADGLLDRASDERDRRAAWVRATASGRRLAERIRRERTQAVNQALAELDPAARSTVIGALPALEALAAALGAPL